MLNLPEKFIIDTKYSKSYSAHPVVVVGWDPISNEPKNDALFISEYKEDIEFGNKIEFFSDQGLKISQIAESLDVENRRHTINNVSLSLSNRENYSETLAKYDILNQKVAIFWKTSSAKSLYDCALVYIGTVKRFTHTLTDIKLQLEDHTQDKLTKKIPYANIGVGERARTERSRNSPIPIAYGKISKAPTVIYNMTANEVQAALVSGQYADGDPVYGYDTLTGGYYLLADDVLDVNNVNRNITGEITNDKTLMIGKENDYWRIFETPPSAPQIEFGNHFFIWDQVTSADLKMVKYPAQVEFETSDEYSTDYNLQEFTVKNPNYAIDTGREQEAIAVGLSHMETYSRFPDSDLDGVVPQTEGTYEDFSGEIDLSSHSNGNFLYMRSDVKIHSIGLIMLNGYWGHTASYNWDGTPAYMNRIGYNSSVAPVFMGHLSDISSWENIFGNTNDDHFAWSEKKNWIFFDAEDQLFSWNFESHHAYNSATQSQGRCDLTKSFHSTWDNSSGSFNKTCYIGGLSRVHQLQHFYIGGDNFDNALIQVPNTEKIRDAVEAQLGITIGNLASLDFVINETAFDTIWNQITDVSSPGDFWSQAYIDTHFNDFGINKKEFYSYCFVADGTMRCENGWNNQAYPPFGMWLGNDPPFGKTETNGLGGE